MAGRSAPMCDSLRMYVCKHPTSPTITHLPLAGRHQTKKNTTSAVSNRGRVTSGVMKRTATSGDYGTPSVTAKAVRAPKHKGVAERSAPMCDSLRMYVCKHPTSPTITHLPLAGRHQTKKNTTSAVSNRGRVTSGVMKRTATSGDYGMPSVTAKTVRAPKETNL